MDENEIYEVLGVAPPAGPVVDQADQRSATGNDGPQGGEGAEPQENQETAEGGVGHESGEAGKNQEDPSGGESGAEKEESTSEIGQPTKDDRREAEERTARIMAEARRLADQQTVRAIEEERARNKAQWDAFFASAGLKNNLDGGRPITSLEEFQAWKAKYDRARLEQDLKEGKLTPEALEAMVAQQVASSGHAQSGDAGGQPPEQGYAKPVPEVTQAQIDAELAEIHRLDGSVNGLPDILKMETGGAFQEAVRRGHSFLDAFKLANFDRIQSKRQSEAAQRAAQAARNSARSKEHLRSSDSKGGGNVAVPGDVMEMYRMMMPGKSEAEITAHYNRMLKEMKQ